MFLPKRKGVWDQLANECERHGQSTSLKIFLKGVIKPKEMKKNKDCSLDRELLLSCIAIAKLSAHLWVMIAKNNIIATELVLLNPNAAPSISEWIESIAQASRAKAGWLES